jgi:hypothetical protein
MGEKTVPTVIVRDALRSSVERQSEGRVTVLYDDREIPSFMLVIPKFRCEDVDSGLGAGVHPAFIVDGVEKNELFLGQFPASEIDGLAYSLPERPAWTSIDFDKSRAACVGKGKGWHLVTSWEWAALLCYVAKTGGKDLVKSYWEWNDGLLLRDGRFFFPNDNNYEAPEESWPDQSCGFDYDESEKIPVLAAKIDRYMEDPEKDIDCGDYACLDKLRKLTSTPDYSFIQRMTRLMIDPIAGSVFSEIEGGLWVRNYGERRPIRGGGWGSGASAGLASLILDSRRSIVSSDIGLRPAFIL